MAQRAARALYAYDDRGRRVSLTRGNGVVTTYAYDSASRLDVLTHNLSGAGSDVTLDFAHNAAGQILSRDRSSANGAYVYPQPAPNVHAYVNNGLSVAHSGRWCDDKRTAVFGDLRPVGLDQPTADDDLKTATRSAFVTQ